MPAIARSQLVVYGLVVAILVVLGLRHLERQGRAGSGGAAVVAGSGGAAGGAGEEADGATDGGGAGAGVDGATDGGEAGAGAGAVRIERAAAGRGSLVHVAGAVRQPGVYRLAEGARVQDAVRRAGGGTRRADLDAINLAGKVADGQQVVVPVRLTGVGSGAAGGEGGAAAASPGGPINLNTATLEQLDTLDGVGPATAQKILDWRREHGGFRSVEDLGQVPGIGPKRLAALRAKVQA